MLNRFIVFGGPTYYAAGGFHDFLDSFADLDEAISFATETRPVHPDIDRLENVHEWWHVFDLEARQCVAASECQAYGAPRRAPNLE